MPLDITCACGDVISVSEGSAGAQRTCRCGRTLTLPSLDEMRRRSGSAGPRIGIDVIVESLLLAEKLPEEKHCVQCGHSTADLFYCRARCSWGIVEGGPPAWWAYVLGFLTFGWLGVAVVHTTGTEEREVGKDRIYDLPLRVCVSCQPSLADAAALKAAVCRAPLYRRLLDHYPGTILSAARWP